MTSVRRLWGRWARSDRSPDADAAARIEELLSANRVRFGAAVRADAAITARYRGEHHEFRSNLDATVQAVRLACITDSFFAQICYRAKTACRRAHVPVIPTILHRLAIVTGQISIGDLAVVQPGIYVPHGQVVVDGLTLIETGVVLRPFVTLGLRDGHIFGPTIASNAMIGTGAKVVGPVRVGARANVGANAVVVADIADRAIAVGVPARART